MIKSFVSAAIAASFFVTGSAEASPVVFNIDFDGGTYDGGGTLTIDDSLIAPFATVFFDFISISIDFAGVHFDTGFASGNEGFTFDGLGEQIVSTTFGGSYTEVLDDPNYTFDISMNNGPVPGTFETSGLLNGNDRGTYTITRATAPSAVPLPAAGALLFPAIGALFLARRRRKA